MRKLYQDGQTPVNPKQASAEKKSEDRSWSRQEFLAWEQASRDTIDVKRCYVDLAQGDLIAGILLSQIIYWHLPNKVGGDKLMVEKDGEMWLAKERADWWDECRVTPKQFDRAADLLEHLGVIQTRIMRFDGSPTKHIRVCWETFLRDLALVTTGVQGGKMEIPQREKTGQKAEGEAVIPQRSKSKFPKGQNGSSLFRNVEISETGNFLTETTAETTAETLPPPEVPPAPVQEEEEDALDVSVQETASQQERVGAMLDNLAALTGTRIEIEALRPLALECARREHKDAWTHTLSVLKAKMACDRKPLNPNRYAATVLATALESPASPAMAPKTAPPAPAPGPYSTPGAPVDTTGLASAPADGAPAKKVSICALRKARYELSGPGAAAFKQEHGRPSGPADWEALASLRTEVVSYPADQVHRARLAMLAHRDECALLLPDSQIAVADMKWVTLMALRDRLVHLVREDPDEIFAGD